MLVRSVGVRGGGGGYGCTDVSACLTTLAAPHLPQLAKDMCFADILLGGVQDMVSSHLRRSGQV